MQKLNWKRAKKFNFFALFHQEFKNVYRYPEWEPIAHLLDLDQQLIIYLEKSSDQLKSDAIT